jgi:hypothetical protein
VATFALRVDARPGASQRARREESLQASCWNGALDEHLLLGLHVAWVLASAYSPEPLAAAARAERESQG